MRLVPFEVAHSEDLLSGNLNDERNRPSNKLGNFIPALVQEGMAFTGIDNGYLVGAAGIYPLWHGVGEAWLLGADRMKNYPLSAARMVRRQLHQIAAAHGMWRVQAAMRSDWPELARWARFLGMEHEGTMRRYGVDGQDYERWAWVDGH